MRGVPAEIQQRWIDHCAKADPAYGAGVAQAIEDIDSDRSEIAGMS
jgi:catalase